MDPRLFRLSYCITCNFCCLILMSATDFSQWYVKFLIFERTAFALLAVENSGARGY